MSSLPEPWMSSRNLVLNGYRQNAKSRQLSFELSDEDCFALFKGRCHYCGAEPTASFNAYLRKDGTARRTYVTLEAHDKSSATFFYNGIDRYDNNLGYTKDNVVPCCWICNEMKGSLSIEVFKGWLRQVVSFRTRAKDGITEELKRLRPITETGREL